MAQPKLAPDSSIFAQNTTQSLGQYLDVITSNEPVGGNIKYYFEKNDDTNFLGQFRKMRDIKDESTSFFVATFLSKDNLLAKFVMYMYQTLYFNLLTKINTKLTTVYTKDGIDLSALPLQPDEKLVLYFKGGTTMKFIYDEFLATLPRATQDAINAQLGKQFKASDTDMGLDIECSSNKRFIVIKNALSTIICETCDHIGTNFDFMLNDNTITDATTLDDWRAKCAANRIFTGNNPGVANRLPAGVSLLNIFGDPHATLAEFQNRIKSVKDTLTIAGYDETLLIKFCRANSIIDSRNTVRECPDNPIICGMVIELIDYYTIMSGRAPSVIITNIKDMLNIGAHQQLFELYLTLHKMYSAENKDAFITALHDKFNSDDFKIPAQDPNNPKNIMKRIYYEKFSSGDKLIRRLQVDIPKANIRFGERADFSVQANDDPYFTSRITNFSTTNKKHYTSVNTSILDEANNIKIDFSLFRVKLNITLDSGTSFETIDNLSNDYGAIVGNGAGSVGQLLIPSEILDVSISGIHDTGHHLIINDDAPLGERNFQINNITYKLFIYSLENHVNDLNFILFKQCGYTPWIDAKYDKRVDRLLFFCLKYIKSASNPDDIRIMKTLLNLFIEFGKNINVVIRNNTRIYGCNEDRLSNFFKELLKYVQNPSDCNFTTITEKYYNNNFPNIVFETYKLNSINNMFTKLINSILLWNRILYTTNHRSDNPITRIPHEINVTNREKSKITKFIYQNNGINLSAVEPDALCEKTKQNYLKFLKTVTDRMAILRPIILP